MFKVIYLDAVTDIHMVGIDVLVVKDDRICKHCFKLSNFRLDFALLVFCFIVFAVFRKVAVCTCLFDRFGNLDTFYRFKMLQLVLQLFKAFLGDINLFCHFN